MAMSFLVLAVGSLVLVVAAPRFGLDASQNAGDWRGLWSEKNTLALFMVIGGLAALCAMMELRRAWWLWSGMFALSAFLLLMSRGKTALLCFALVTALTGALWLMRRGSVAFVLTLWSMVTAGALVGFLTWQAPGVLLTAVGKDATLTGRTQIWTAVLNQVALHPLTGFGFAAFWERTSVPALIIRKQTGWVVPTAHNGWLDLLVQVGWIGVGLFMAVFLIAIVAIIVRTVRTREYFGALYLTLFGVFSVSESFLEQHNSLMWVLFVTVLTQALGPVTVHGQASASPARSTPGPPRWTLARGTEIRT
jgi:O-antigen ligase